MSDINNLINEITETLKEGGVEKVILFGSYAKGTAGEESDLDIIVVTSDDFFPSSNREKVELHHKYNNLIRNFRKQVPIDMIVYTRLMYNNVMESGSMFARELRLTGKTLYEAAYKGMA